MRHNLPVWPKWLPFDALWKSPTTMLAHDHVTRDDVAAEHRGMSFNDSVVVGVAAYPEPQQAFRYVNGQCPIVHPNTH